MGFHARIIGIHRRQQSYHMLAFSVAGSLLLFFISASFKLHVVVVCLLLLVLYLLTKNLLFSLFGLLLLTSQFVFPGKYYTFEIAKVSQLRYEPLFEKGVLDSYGLIASDIVAVALSLYMASRLLTGIWERHTTFIRKLMVILKDVRFRLMILLWLLYFTLSLFSSTHFSFSPVFSVSNLLQNMKMVPMYLGSIWIVIFAKKYRRPFYYILMGMILFQGIIGLYQLVERSQEAILGQAFVTSYAVAEEDVLIPRIKGSFSHPNQLAFMLFLWTLIVPWRRSISRRARFVLVSVAAGGIILSQSRTVWLLGLLFLLLFIRKKANVFHGDKGHPSFRPGVTVKIFPILLLVAAVVVPRAYLSRFAFDYGAGDLRIRMIKEGLSVLSVSPPAGFGINTNVYVMSEYFPRGYIQDFPFAIHLAYLQMALESGIIATGAFFLPFFILLFRSSTGNAYSFGLKFAIASVLIYYLFQPHGGKAEFPYLGLVAGVVYAQGLFIHNKFRARRHGQT